MRIRINHIIIALALLGYSESAGAHSRKDVGEWYLEFVMLWDGDSWNVSLSPEDPYYNDDESILFIDRKTGQTPKLLEEFPSKESKEIPWSLIRGVTFVFKNEDGKCPSESAVLSQFKVLEDCPLDSITSLSVLYYEYDCRLEVDIDSLTWLNNPSRKKALAEVIMMGDHAPELKIQTLKEHPIVELELTTPLGQDIEDYKHLRILRMPGLRSTFAFNAARNPNLVDVSESDGIYRNRFHHEHAERYFWLKYLPSIKMPIGQSIDIKERGNCYHPLNRLISYTEAHYPGRIERGGEVYVIEDELPEEARYEHDGDTLLHGFIDGDTLQGIWTFRVQEQYGFNDEESFHLDLSAELPAISENGSWELKYLAGNMAISGFFKDGLKEGEWLFYTESGELVCKRYFHADTLDRTIVNFHMRGNPLQSRAYFFSPNASIQSFENNGEISFMYIDLWKDEKDPLVITNQSISIMNGEGNYKIYNRNHPEFETIFREVVIDKVYPEYIGQELPFSY